jgi:ankyrin repeat protein
MAEKLLGAGANPNATQTSGLTPLMIAARTGSILLTNMLLARGAHANVATVKMHATPLMWAVMERHADIARAIIDAKADVRAATSNGFTVLMYAALNGDVEMARTLISAGANVNDAAPDGTNLLPFAILCRHDTFAFFLLDQGADPNGVLSGIRVLHVAAGDVGAWSGSWLRRLGSDNVFEGDGEYQSFATPIGPPFTPARRLALVKALLARGADPNARISLAMLGTTTEGYAKGKGAFDTGVTGTGNLRGATPLWVAARTANSAPVYLRIDRQERPFDPAVIEIMTSLLAAGADPLLTTDDGTTPLMAAAGLGILFYDSELRRGTRSRNAEEAVKLLLNAGSDVNAVNEGDFTALHGAAFRGLDEVIQILVDHGANINARDFRGRTPYRLAEGGKQSTQLTKYPETAEFLKRLGANAGLSVPAEVQERARDLVVEMRLP